MKVHVAVAKQGEFLKRRKELICQRCKGTKKLICERCQGTGKLGKGGYNAKNPLNLSSIVGIASMVPLLESLKRRFQVDGNGEDIWMAALSSDRQEETWIKDVCIDVCDLRRHDTILGNAFISHFFNPPSQINSQSLRDRDRWSCGWLRKSQLEEGMEKRTVCRMCHATGWIGCPYCT